MRERQQNVTLVAIIVSLILVIFSIGLIYLSIAVITDDHPVWKEIVRALGSLLLVSVLVANLWELFLRRRFTKELLATVALSDNIEDSGLDQIVYQFEDINWRDYFEGSKRFEVFISYGRSWRGTNEPLMKDLAKRRGAKVRIALPDPDNERLVAEMAARYNKEPAEIERLVREAIEDYNRIFHGCKGYDLVIVDTLPYYGYYRFDDTVIATFYSYGREKADIPTFFVTSGRLRDFLTNEFEKVFRVRSVKT